MFERGNILTLSDDKDYTVIDKYNDGDVTYVYLVDTNDVGNIIYAKLENDEIVTLDDPVELEKVIHQVHSHIHNF